MDLNLKELQEILTDVKSGLNRFNSEFLLKEGNKINNAAKRRTPVDTGALRASWVVVPKKINTKDVEIEIKNDQNYASFVEYGTSKMKERNMLTTPLNNYDNKKETLYKQELTKYLKGKGL